MQRRLDVGSRTVGRQLHPIPKLSDHACFSVRLGHPFPHPTLAAYNALSLIDVNYIVNCYVNPTSCE
jgi:hypothetical protein